MDSLCLVDNLSTVTKNNASILATPLKKLSCLTIAITMTLSISPAFAANCSLANPLFCTQSVNHENLIYTKDGITSAIDLNAISILGNEGVASITLFNSHIIGDAEGHGIFLRGTNAIAEFSGNNSITLNNGTNRTAVMVMGEANVSGNASIMIHDEFNININHSGYTLADGLNVQGVNTSITHDGSGSITTNGGNAISSSAVKDVKIILDGLIKLNVSGVGNRGIETVSQTGNTFVQSNATMSIIGDYSHGIDVTAYEESGRADIINTGAITTDGQFSHAIFVAQSGDDKIVNINNQNTLHMQGSTSRGIYMLASGRSIINVINGGNIIHDNATDTQYGIEILTENDVNVRVDHNGLISGSLFGIIAWAWELEHLGSSAEINIGSQGMIDSVYGIVMDMSDDNVINIANGGRVNGKTTAVLLRGYTSTAQQHVVNNSGSLTSNLDQIITTNILSSDSTVTINNLIGGQITGGLVIDHSHTIFTNHGLWNLRAFADTDEDGVRDQQSIAIANFGVGNTSYRNEAAGVLNLSAVNGPLNINDFGEYSTLGTLNTINAGTVQGQLLNLNRFENRGTIDLTENQQAGDILLITASGQGGVNGNGQFIADGGRLILDTILNDGDINSLSDILVVDNVVAGAKVMQVMINRVGGMGGVTNGDGIKVIEVLGHAQAGSFVLGSAVKAGIYEYTLHQGSSTAPGDNHLYLRSFDGQVNPDVGSYLANQTAATNLFMHTLHDRLGESQDELKDNTLDKAIPAVWLRVVAGKAKSEAANSHLTQNAQNTLVHLGGDIASWAGNGDNRYHLGVMGAYGRSETKTTSKVTGTRVNSMLDGYGVGAYLTWYQDPFAQEGGYTDVWSMYNWFDNQTEGSDNYHSKSWTTSVEAGYANKLKGLANYDWMLEPQAQVAYNYYHVDTIKDHNGLDVRDSTTNGVATRLGGRTYLRPSTTKIGAQPFVEVNWLYNSASNSMVFNGEKITDNTPKNRYEAKVGVRGEITDNLQMYSHIALQVGQNNYQSSQGQLGMKYRF